MRKKLVYHCSMTCCQRSADTFTSRHEEPFHQRNDAKKVEENLLKKLETLKRMLYKSASKINKNLFKMDSETLRNRRLEGVWEVLGATLAPKFYQNLSWTSLVDFGRARIDQNLAQMAQDALSWTKMVILRSLGELS